MHLMEQVLQDAKKWVENAIAFYEVHGEDTAFAEISNPRGQFADDERRVYVLGLHGAVLSHPVNENFEGLDLCSLHDIEGRGFIKGIMDASKKSDFDWVRFLWYDRPTRMLRPQRVYFKRCNEMIFCSAFYLS